MTGIPVNPEKHKDIVEACKCRNIAICHKDGTYKTLQKLKAEIVIQDRNKYWRHDIKITRERRKLGTLPKW